MKLEVGKKYKAKWGDVYEVQSEHTVYQLKQEGSGNSGYTSEHDTNDFTPFVEPKFKKGDLICFTILNGLRRIEEVFSDKYRVSIWCESNKSFIASYDFSIDWTHENAVVV